MLDSTMNCHFLIQYELLPAVWPQTGHNDLSNITYMYRIAFKTYFLRFCNFIHVLVKKKLLPTNFFQYFYIEITRKSSALGWTNRRTVLLFKKVSKNVKIGSPLGKIQYLRFCDFTVSTREDRILP